MICTVDEYDPYIIVSPHQWFCLFHLKSYSQLNLPLYQIIFTPIEGCSALTGLLFCLGTLAYWIEITQKSGSLINVAYKLCDLYIFFKCGIRLDIATPISCFTLTYERYLLLITATAKNPNSDKMLQREWSEKFKIRFGNSLQNSIRLSSSCVVNSGDFVHERKGTCTYTNFSKSSLASILRTIQKELIIKKKN